MADLTIPIIGLTTLIGYFFSKDDKNPRVKPVSRQTTEEFEKPNGSTIYASNKVAQVNEEMLNRSLANYELAKNPSQTGVLPPLFNTYSTINNKAVLETDYKENVPSMAQVNAVNRYQKFGQKEPTTPLNERPMFKSLGEYSLSIESRPDSNVSNFDTTNDPENQQISLLTGKPIDMNHTNMVPFFGSNVKQNVESFANTPLLDAHTGNTSVFAHKKEVGEFFQNTPQNIYGMPVFTTEISTDRYISSQFKQNEKPFEENKISAPISGTFDNNIRPAFKDVNELRPGNNPKETYEARLKAGQFGQVRGVQSKFVKQRPETFYEKNSDHLFSAPGSIIAPKIDENFNNFKPTSRQDYAEESYIGAPNTSSLTKTKQRVSSLTDLHTPSDSIVQDPKRINFANDFSRNINPSTPNGSSDYGKSAITPFVTERETTSVSRLSNVRNLDGGKNRPSDLPKTTGKETMINHNRVGPVKTSFDTGLSNAFNSGVVEFSAKTTHKESTVNNKYIGNSDRKDGMGYLVNKYSAPTTGKEIITNNSQYSGNAAYSNGESSRSQFANADIQDRKESVLAGARPSGPQSFATSSGKASFAELKHTENMLIKERENDREKIHVNVQQLIPDKYIIGYVQQFRKDADNEDTINRLAGDLVTEQLQKNPFSLKSSSRVDA